MAADYYNMAGDRRAELMNTHPQLVDRAHADALDYCYDKAREYEEKAKLIGTTEGEEWQHEYIFDTHSQDH